MAHTRFRQTPAQFLVAMAVSLSAVALADTATVRTIYAAENALYGAGYGIGSADGWMDGALRSAIRQYQSDTRGIKATGKLDQDTLSALGVAAQPGVAISGNSLPDRKAAMAALELKEERFKTVTESRPVAAVSQPEPQPEPEALPEASGPEPAPTGSAVSEAEPVGGPGQAANVARADAETEPAPDPKSLEEPAPEVLEAAAELAITSEPRPQVVDVQTELEIPIEAPAMEPEPISVPQPEVVVQPADSPDAVVLSSAEESAGDPSNITVQLPDEPTAAGNTPASEPDDAVDPPEVVAPSESASEKSSGGFFSALFDFLFGWLG